LKDVYRGIGDALVDDVIVETHSIGSAVCLEHGAIDGELGNDELHGTGLVRVATAEDWLYVKCGERLHGQ